MAYLLTWTTYGTWLPGDERSSVDDVHNRYGQPGVPSNEAMRSSHAARMRDEPVALDARAREVVAQAINDHSRIRGWKMVALNVRSNHVHAVVGRALHAPEEMVAQLKSWSTRRLREAGLVGAEQPVWTKRASTRYWDDESVYRASHYVLIEQDRPERFA